MFALIFLWTTLATFTGISGEILKQEPIVIKTPVSNYVQPNFEDYKSCMKALDDCTASCEDVEACLLKCKKCPMLIKEDIVVQGVNDTDYKAISNAPLNSTNIIRVTNEIHNVIENNFGDILSKNENNVNIYTKNTSSCDKFGLGCNENGTCCYIVKNHKRQKHCGQFCQSRVMYERTIVQCMDEANLDSCKKIIEYKPLRTKRTKHVTDNYRCRYDSKWPFVACRNRKEITDRCSPICLSLSYLYILQHGIPLHCMSCYKSFDDASKDYIPPLIDDDRNLFVPHEDKDWVLENTKCRLEDGTISENCGTTNNQVTIDNELGSGDDGNNIIDAGLESFNALDDTDKRRNEFRRSKYSLRHKRKQLEAK